MHCGASLEDQPAQKHASLQAEVKAADGLEAKSEHHKRDHGGE